MNIRICLLVLFVSARVVSWGQKDTTSLPLTLEKLTEKDIEVRDIGLAKAVAISGTRSLEEVDKLPFSIWVITAEDILRYGFVTLADVLKAAPGVRVSQPGNAVEGETFLLRGLNGNEYMKVLINDVPVKPTIALGMPIGAQLPIRQAERIEVYFGPASAMYGSDACAGVVNIILKESERPIYTQADLSFGRYGYNSLDLMFGGKLGRDKKIFRFSLYGSSTIRENADLFYDKNLFDANNYLPFGLDSSVYLDNRNFRGESDTSSIARVASVNHESRMLGLNLNWRGLYFNYLRMKRVDHQALGLSPLAISWGNPSTRLDERLEIFNLGFQKRRKYWTSYNNLSFMRYSVAGSSNANYVFDRLSAAGYSIGVSQTTTDLERLFLVQNLFDVNASNERYSVANGADGRFESRFNAYLRKNLYFDAGIQATLTLGAPLSSHYQYPVVVDVFGNTNQPFSLLQDPYSVFVLDVNEYAQIQWYTKKWTLVGGVSNSASSRNTSPAQFVPRLGVLYRIDSAWSVYANYSEGFRNANPYAIANTYTFHDTGIGAIRGENNINNDQGWFKGTESLKTAEVGLRYKQDGVGFTLSAFRQQGFDLVRYNRSKVFTTRQGDEMVLYGYNNVPGLGQQLYVVQGLWSAERSSLELSGLHKKQYVTTRIEFFIQYAKGKEWLNPGAAPTVDVFNMPHWMTQFRWSWRTGLIQMMFASNRQTSVLSKAVAYQERYQRQVITERYPTFRTWDWMTRAYLSNHFVVYFLLQNVFNRHHAGLDATGSPDDLLYNPQQGRTWRIGVNYNMN